jgi:serine phosphatase RsbU (regulator of sigma subunit)/ligand-binding sensor domain-containing protein
MENILNLSYLTWKKKLLILSLFINSIFCTLSAQDLAYDQISIGQGLSNVNASVIIQDKFGFLWIGTEDGLNRYDGYEFKVYKNVPANSETLIDNAVWDIAEEDNGNLWIATFGGISYFDRLNNTFRNYNIDSLTIDVPSQFPKTVSVHIDKKERIWIGSLGGGILRYNSKNDEFEKVEVSTDTETTFNGVYRMAENDKYLFANHFGYGMLQYNEELDKFEKVKFSSEGEILNNTDPENRITKLFIDHSNTLWIVTDRAILKMDIETKVLRTVVVFETMNVFDLWRVFTGLTQDKEGNIWIGKDMRGIYKFDGISDDYTFIPFGAEYVNKPNTYGETVRSMYTDNTGIIWIGTFTNGLFKHDPATKPFYWYAYDSKNKNSISGNEIFGLAESNFHENRIYVGLRGSGLNTFNPETEHFKKININFENDAFGGSVRAILENEDGSVYLGTWGDGLFNYSDKLGSQLVSNFDPENNSSLSFSRVRKLKKDSEGKVWVGTINGLSIYDPVYDNVQRIYTTALAEYPQELLDLIEEKVDNNEVKQSILRVGDDADITESFSIERPRDYLVVSLGEGIVPEDSMVDYGWIEDNKANVIWSAQLVAENKKLSGADKNRLKVSLVRLNAGLYKLRYKSDDSHSFGKWNADEPRDSSWWGIQLIDINKDEYELVGRVLAEDKNSFTISGSNIWAIHFSKSNSNITWLGYQDNGIDRYDKSSNTTTNYRYDPKDPSSLSNNNVRYIHEDKNGILWIATDAGLNRFDPTTEKFDALTEDDGLPTNYISSILEDNYGNMWISTRNGISRMTFSDNRPTFVNYDSEDGLGGVDFIPLVALKTNEGELYFGGEHGLNRITPGSINQAPPDLLLTDLRVGGKSVSQFEKAVIDKSIFEVEELTLSYNQNDLAFEFAALHFARAEKNQYAHKLEGYDKEWTYDNRKYASYTNLDPGEYRFVFRGSNSEGVWNDEGRSILIEILPPWWQTTWAYIGYALMFVLVIVGIDRIQRRRLLAKVREKRRIEEAETRAEAAELQAKAAEAERKMLEAENVRKTQELEEARNLQLSMLPKELPQLPNLDIAVYMKTATEVGGDYYDFHVGMDGTLTVVLGDATGHGMKAGTMVTSVKSLFNVLAPNPDIVVTFHEITRCIKLMQMEKLSMCMTMLKIKGDTLQMSAAGMPPTFIYKHNIKTIEEHVFKGMPLGTMDNFPYDNRETKLEPGDTILVMSDGFPELLNKNGEQYGYKNARNKFEEVSEGTPEQIIDILKNEGSEWVDGVDPDDDVTFVVIKVK